MNKLSKPILILFIIASMAISISVSSVIASEEDIVYEYQDNGNIKTLKMTIGEDHNAEAIYKK
ncbi:MAG: hypothetical protein QGI05_00835 [Candidatus Omnitrophota bacterium]|jgi:hypothetical protein|nr:hypothetical protein [Candidatus Omnitrophota bacterium]|tara:strand:- start:289 stop:477 length:189 start_codon:yes stop_codon:yes gene_type:complete